MGAGMELAYCEVLLVLAMAFSLVGAAANVCFGVLPCVRADDAPELSSFDLMVLVPVLSLVLGLAAALASFLGATPMIGLLGGNGALGWVIFWIAAAIAVIPVAGYAMLTLTGKMTHFVRRRLLCISGATSLVYLLVVAGIHAAAPGFLWMAFPIGVLVLGSAFAGGAALSAVVVESADVVCGDSSKRLQAAVLSCGSAMGVLGFVFVVACSEHEALSDIASTNIAVGLFCLVATLAFGLLGIFSKDRGYYSVISAASAFVSLFCMYLVLYTSLS